MNSLVKIPTGEQLSTHFKDYEFACRCCGKYITPPDELLQVLEQIRHAYSAPVVITSGYRCPAHNKNVGGATHSRHIVGDAVDIKVSNVDAIDVYATADTLVGGSGGVGKYPTWVHIDWRGYRARW